MDISFGNPVNGLKTCSIKTSRFKLSDITVSFFLPLSGDISANAMLPFILRRSCAKFPTMSSLNRRLAELYGAIVSSNVAKVGEAQMISFRVCAPDDRFSLDGNSIACDCAQLLSDLIFEPHFVNGTFDSQDIEREKRLLIENIESELNDKKLYAFKRCVQIMCENETFSIDRYGKIQDIRSMTADRLLAAWKNMLETAVVQFNVVGSSDAQQVGAPLLERFKAVDRGRIADIGTEFVKSAGEVRRVREEMEIKQGKLVLGYRAGVSDANDNSLAMRVMCDLFGGGPYSRLFTNVREKLSLCYYCGARFNRQKGIITVQSGIEDENEQKAIDAISAELACLASGNFKDSELEASLKGLTDMIGSVPDSPEGLDSWYTSQIFDSEILSPEEYAKGISRVTREQVIKAAQGVSLDTVYMLGVKGGAVNED